MKKLLLVASVAASLLTSCSRNKVVYDFPFQNPDLSVDERVEDLIYRLTPEEKVGLMMNDSRSVDRLDIPAYNWWSEACHCLRIPDVTIFPQAIGLAATFDLESQKKTFTAISDEGRAVWNISDHHRLGKDTNTWANGNDGLSFWCPNINIFRDPRWGRGQETSGEDPFLTSQMGRTVVETMQEQKDGYYKTIACAKHFAVHSGPESSRHRFDVSVTPRDFWETYMPAFKTLVTEAGVRQVMCAYNRYDGEPCCASNALLSDILRNRWDYDGIVVSDCGAIDNFFVEGRHETHPDAASATADAVIHGTDLECGTSYMTLLEALDKDQITIEQIDNSLRKLLKYRILLGTLDPDDRSPWKDLDSTDIASAEHNALALESARKSMVLLKNDGILPLDKDVKSIAVVGPNADNLDMQYGNYNGTPIPEYQISILDAFRRALPKTEIKYAKGCDLVSLDRTFDYSSALDSIDAAEIVIYVGGLSPRLEGEEMPVKFDGFLGGDRTKIELPQSQIAFLEALRSTGKPVVYVNCTGSAVALENVDNCYNALIQAWYGGQAAGQAIVDVIFGDYNPAGRLPVTFYKSTSQLPDFEDYSMEGRTYRYFHDDVMYPFGYGLSYTEFEYGDAKLSSCSVNPGDKVEITVPVSNVGSRDGEEVVQVYVKSLDLPEAPIKSLKGFARVAIAAGNSADVKFSLGPDAFQYYDSSCDGLMLHRGRYLILYGGSSADSALKSVEFEIK